MQQRTKQSSGLSAWLAQLTSRTHHNVAVVALANKLSRIAWAVLAKNEPYRPRVLADVAAAYRRLREHNFLPGLLANEEMAQRSNPALSKPVTGRPYTFAQTNLRHPTFHLRRSGGHTFRMADLSGLIAISPRRCHHFRAAVSCLQKPAFG